MTSRTLPLRWFSLVTFDRTLYAVNAEYAAAVDAFIAKERAWEQEANRADLRSRL